MKIFLSPSNQDENTYAYGNTNESEQCGAIAEELKKKLERCCFDVMLMHDEDMATKVAKANAWDADFYIPIHSNAYMGTTIANPVSGTRLFYYEAGKDLCNDIFGYLDAITPGTSSNVSQNKSLYETRMPDAISAFIEIDFHDIPDVAKWIIENHDAIAEAICKGICKYCKCEYVEEEKKEELTTKTLYRVQTGAYRYRANAEKQLQKLKEAGFDGFIVEVQT